MSFQIGMMAFSAFTQMQGIQSQKRAEQARANSLERQSYDEMKRSQLGAQQDHNDRIAAFRDYEESVVLASGGRNDRSITAITESARNKSVDALQRSSIRFAGQQAKSAMQGDNARLDRAFASVNARNKSVGLMMQTGMRMYEVSCE